ncbi:MAG: GAF domain-containing sensor histidine kinase [Chloroflexi bacterium]|nr:GAF domain-containing sensor histidine kinase [Chloroflexota bacterium]
MEGHEQLMDQRRRIAFEPRVTLRRLRCLGVLAPLAFLAFYLYLIQGPAHVLIHTFWGQVLLLGSTGLFLAAFSALMFRFIGRLQSNVERLSHTASTQNAQLKALNEANLALSEERLMSSVLQRVVELSRELVQARYAALSVVGDDGAIRAFYTAGLDERARQAIGPLPTGKGLLGLMLKDRGPLRLERISDHPDSSGFPPGHPPMTSFLGVPILHKGRTVGSLYLTDKTSGGPFTREDEEIVQLFANQAAVTIQNARLYDQTQALAVETERVRISREMHDGLAQVLGYVNTKAQAVETFLANGETAVAQEQVRELSEAARSAYQDIREGILALRSQVGAERDLSQVLDEYVAEYQRQSRLQVLVRWDFSPADTALTPLQEVQIIRIIQEALTNVRKHAEAAHVNLDMKRQGDELHVQVEDDGRGFNPAALRRVDWPHFGLQTMQERAEAIGGTLGIESHPGQGTRVLLRVPGAIHPKGHPEGERKQA